MKIALKQYRDLLVDYLSPQLSRIVWLAITLLGSIGLQLLNPQILRYFIDTAVNGGSQQSLFIAAVLFITVALVTQILAVSATYLGENVAWVATNALRADLVEHCLKLDLSFHKLQTPGELVERVDGDVGALSRFFSQFTINVLGNAILLLGVLVILLYEDWRAGLGLTFFTITALLILVKLRSRAVSYWVAYRQVGAEFFGFLGEQLAATEDIRGLGAVSYVMHRFYVILQRWLPTYHQARFAETILWGTTIGLFAALNAIALAVSAYLWSQHTITIGTVYLIFYYSNLLQKPIEQIRTHLEDLQQAQASIYRIKELLQVKSKQSPGGDKQLAAGGLSVVFEHVSFSYDKAPTLQNISFHLPAGQVLGLLGRTGSGKTTLARLLLRLYDPQQGSIRLGGMAIDSTPMRDLRQRVGLVTQDVQLFQTTVRNNLTFFNNHVKDEQIQETLELLGLSEWLQLLPNGLDTQLGSDSGGLSAGEAQLLAFVRIFLKNPGLVILDEASSRLDPTTEKLIESAVDKLLQGRTGIIIAHRLATVQRADQILILEKGEIIEYGERENLANDPNSRFARLLKTGLTDVLV
ncbi:ABC transporter ATP-binding protein [Iningainema tapete]|uniref:ABC transporter ATP-binding protein n=1 Tax=Iningainema tapete BLCC-T55 TaxID=2748662 RepID=A0A8J7CBY8_9CYAN|nr:ABC transporter ATP-binding protein [Iningainema tapete]MBD2778906.1 ABC transporter ATP-binding protein [Iningainema tapete BLCC-T55]